MTGPYRDDDEALRERHAAAERELTDIRKKLAEARELEKAERALAEEVEALRRRLDGARRARALPLLENIRIASPCKADWDEMVGDDKMRFCGRCQKNVYNLSAMTRDEAEAFVRQHGASSCVRLYKRADGTVLTSDCPVGVWKRRQWKVAAAVGGALATGALGITASGAFMMGAPRPVMGELEPIVGEPVVGRMELVTDPPPAPETSPTAQPSDAPAPSAGPNTPPRTGPASPGR